MNDNTIKVVNWNETVAEKAKDLLKHYKETSLFLLGNLKDFGPHLGESIYSGNYKCLIQENEVIAVFVLTKVGNVILQTDRKRDYSDIILNACLEENLPIKGVIGEYSLATAFFEACQTMFPTLEIKLSTKEVLYKLDLNTIETLETKDPSIRFLEKSDYALWNPIHKHFTQELNLGQNGDEQGRYRNFIQCVTQKRWWGLFEDKKLISMCNYISFAEETAQIGGVYTIPEQREQGFSKRVFTQMIEDSKTIHNIETLILFTPVDNTPARALYEGLGFERIGDFGLIFWKV